MDKIYSRKRIRLPKRIIDPNGQKYKNKKKLFMIIAIFSIAFLTVQYMLNAIDPIINQICESEAKAIATKYSNQEATKVMEDFEYEDLITISKDDKGNITSIKTNIVPINKIISEVPIRIQEDFEKENKTDIKISLGSFTGSKVLSGRGPKVPIRISNIGDVETDFKSEFKAVGINQSLHRLYLNVTCRVAILTPFSTIERKITNQVILAENVIVGQIPSTYYNLEGLNTTKEALEIVE